MISNYLSQVFKSLPAPSLVLLTDAPRFTIAEVNDAYLELVQMDRNALVGKGFHELFPWNSQLERLLGDGVTNEAPVSKYLIARDGEPEVKYLHAVNTPVRNEAGALTCILRTVTDVTEITRKQKLVEQELIQSHRQFESLIQTVDGIVWEADAHTFEFRFISDQVRNILGYTPEQWLRDPDFWQNHIHPDDRDQAIRFCHLETQEMRNHTFDYRMIAADGRLVWIKDVVSVISENGKPLLLRGLMVDITKVRQEEHELKLLVSVITNTNDAVLIAESDPRDITGLKILYVNAAFTRITGYSPVEVVGKSPALLKGFSPARNDFDRLKDAIFHLEPLKGATMRYARHDDECFINLSLLPVADVRGVHTHWIAIGHDVTDRLRYISEIEERNHKLQEIAWMQSHVIRAPLARLMGLIDLIRNYEHSETEQLELLDHVLTSAYALDDIIRDISSKTERI